MTFPKPIEADGTNRYNIPIPNASFGYEKRRYRHALQERKNNGADQKRCGGILFFPLPIPFYRRACRRGGLREKHRILTGAGKTRWHTSTINKILRNEKYIGDALLQKTYTTDFLSKTRVKNNGIVPQYYVEGDHEAIIPRDIYMRVQVELVRRRVVKTSANGKKRSYSCNHCFSQIVVCGECGELFRRIHWNNRGCKSIVWRCISRLEPTGQECHARTVNETILENVVLTAINKLLGISRDTRNSFSRI